jgi:hypothetical protein
MLASGSMTVKAVMLYLNLRRVIAACIALMARLPVRLYKKAIVVVLLVELNNAFSDAKGGTKNFSFD